tara:strand:+ start:528 stop:1832 length:1305 start_codon:yes stop_codon:yes gene_type:complete
MAMSKTYCLYPFVNLNSNTEGSVKLCCSINENIHATDKDGRELNFGNNSVEEIWNSDYMTTIRKQLLNGERPEACNVCWNLEDQGLRSSRQSAFAELKDRGLYAKDYQDPNPPLPQSLELRLGNFCNLRCNSCWSLSSDRIYDERSKIMAPGPIRRATPDWLKDEWNYELDLARQANWVWWENEEFIETIRKIAPTLKRLYLTGGEPTLIKRNTEVMQTILDSGNKDCYIALTTNLTNWDEKFFNTMSQFNNGELQVSIDDVRERNEYIRFPTKWQKVEDNLAKITVTFPQSWLIKHYTVYQVYNFDAPTQILDWLHHYRSGFSYDRGRVYIWSPIILDHPAYLNTRIIPLEVRKEYAYYLRQYKPPVRIKNIWYQHGIDQVCNLLENVEEMENAEELRSKFIDYSNVLDRQRRPDKKWYELFDSLARALKYEQ